MAKKPDPLDAAIKLLRARPDIRIIIAKPMLVFAVLRFAVEKRTLNPDGFSPLIQERDLFYCEVWEMHAPVGRSPAWRVENIASNESFIGKPDVIVVEAVSAIHPKVRERLTPKPKTVTAPPPISRW